MRSAKRTWLAGLSLILVLLGTSWAEGEAVDAKTLTGKVMYGYQGWFNCEGDGADLGWTHWSRRRNQP